MFYTELIFKSILTYLCRGFYWLSGHKLIVEKFQIAKVNQLPKQLVMNIDENSGTISEDDIEKQIQDSGLLLGQPNAAMIQAAQQIRNKFRNGQP